MTKCNECGATIIVIPNGTNDIWIHSETDKICQYKDEGVQISVVDPLIQQKFKELNKRTSKIKEIYKILFK